MPNKHLRDMAVNSDDCLDFEEMRSNSQINSIIPYSICKNLTIIPITKKLPDSSKIMGRDKNRLIERVLCKSKQPLTSSNSKISKKLSTSSIGNKENNVITMLKKLPDITFDFVKSDQIFKVPKIPKHIKVHCEKVNKSEVIFKNKVLLKTENIKKSSVLNNYKKMNSSLKTVHEKPKQLDNNQVITNIDNNKIQNKTEAPKNFLKINLQKNSFYNRSKVTITKSVEDFLNTSNDASKKTIFSDESMSIKTDDSANNDKCMLIDSNLLFEEDHIAPKNLSSDFINTSIPEYDSFLMGIILSPQDSSTRSNMYTETFHNDVGKGIESSIG